MTCNSPLPISDDEWNELASHPVVRDNWHLAKNEHGDALSAQAYGVKFDYQYDVCPIDRTDLYVLIAWMGDGAHGDAKDVVVMLFRDHKRNGCLEPITLPFLEDYR